MFGKKRVERTDVLELAARLREARKEHAQLVARTGEVEDWAMFYACYLLRSNGEQCSVFVKKVCHQSGLHDARECPKYGETIGESKGHEGSLPDSFFNPLERVRPKKETKQMKSNLLIATLVIVSMSASGVLAGAGFAQRADVPRHQDKVSLGSEKAKELLLLMDTDKSGKISKQEWMKFMEAEFDRLDKNKIGEIDLKELRLSNVAVNPKRFGSVGK